MRLAIAMSLIAVLAPQKIVATGCTVAFDGAGKAYIACTSGLTMTCKP